MNFRKSLCIAAALALTAITTHAQIAGVTTAITVPSLAATTGNTNVASTAGWINVADQRTVAIDIYTTGLSSNATGSLTVTIAPSLDGSTWDLAKYHTLIGTVNSSNSTALVTTNLDTGGYLYYKVLVITNASAMGLTNTQIRYSTKPRL